jgi:hypothetical protein
VEESVAECMVVRRGRALLRHTPRGSKNPLKHDLCTREAIEEPIQSNRPSVQVASAQV